MFTLRFPIGIGHQRVWIKSFRYTSSSCHLSELKWFLCPIARDLLASANRSLFFARLSDVALIANSYIQPGSTGKKILIKPPVLHTRLISSIACIGFSRWCSTQVSATRSYSPSGKVKSWTFYLMKLTLGSWNSFSWGFTISHRVQLSNSCFT